MKIKMKIILFFLLIISLPVILAYFMPLFRLYLDDDYFPSRIKEILSERIVIEKEEREIMSSLRNFLQTNESLSQDDIEYKKFENELFLHLQEITNSSISRRTFYFYVTNAGITLTFNVENTNHTISLYENDVINKQTMQIYHGVLCSIYNYDNKEYMIEKQVNGKVLQKWLTTINLGRNYYDIIF